MTTRWNEMSRFWRPDVRTCDRSLRTKPAAAATAHNDRSRRQKQTAENSTLYYTPTSASSSGYVLNRTLQLSAVWQSFKNISKPLCVDQERIWSQRVSQQTFNTLLAQVSSDWDGSLKYDHVPLGASWWPGQRVQGSDPPSNDWRILRDSSESRRWSSEVVDARPTAVVLWLSCVMFWTHKQTFLVTLLNVHTAYMHWFAQLNARKGQRCRKNNAVHRSPLFTERQQLKICVVVQGQHRSLLLSIAARDKKGVQWKFIRKSSYPLR